MNLSALPASSRTRLDFAARLLFFASAPFAVVLLAAVFPVWGALFSVGLSLGVILAGEAFRARANFSRIGQFLISRELDLARYYEVHPPRPFVFYALYPLLIPYWLFQRDARREFWLFKGDTLASYALLLASVIYQYLRAWAPDLGVRAFLGVVGVSLVVEALLVLWLLMPMATTVIVFHAAKRSRELRVLLLVALLSTGAVTARLALRRGDVVTYDARERIYLRTAKKPQRARDVHVMALRAAWRAVVKTPGSLEEDGRVEGPPLDKAREVLATFYKKDEARAFDLWASPRRDPRLLVLYFEADRGREALWRAMRLGGEEVRDASKLPRGAFEAMDQATQ